MTLREEASEAHIPLLEENYTPRRLAVVRRLMLVSAVIFFLIGGSDFVLARQHAVEVFIYRVCAVSLLLVVWWLSRHSRTRNQLAAWVCVAVLVVSIGQSLSMTLDRSILIPSLNSYVLLVLITGPLWSEARHFIAGMASALAPPMVALSALGVELATWVAYAVYLSAAAMGAFTLWRTRLRASFHSAQLRSELEHRAVSDGLTGILNRAGWDQHANIVLQSAVAAGLPVSLIYLDLDHFKAVNDRYGHAAGDEVLEATARLIRIQVRHGDLVARIGGEEFVALLIGVGLETGTAVAERIRSQFEYRDGPIYGTLSAGVAQLSNGEDLRCLLARADSALMRAKRQGRNRVVQSLVPA